MARTTSDLSIETGDIEIGAVELKDGTSDNRLTVIVDNATATGTPTVAMVGAIYKDAADTYADNDATPFHTDINGNIKTTEVSRSTLTGGSKTVTTGGTAEALGASLACKSVYIRAKAANTNNVYVGDSAVDKTTSQQIVLDANDSVIIDVANRATVYVDADTNGEGVDYLILS